MSERVSLLARPSVPEIAPSDRIACGPRSIAVVDSLPNAPIATSIARFASAAGLRVRRARVRLRVTPGHETLGPGDVATHPDSLVDAARSLVVDDGALLLIEGAALFAATSPRLAILGTLSPSLASLDPDVRALRDRFDLVLYDARPTVLDRIVRALA